MGQRVVDAGVRQSPLWVGAGLTAWAAAFLVATVVQGEGVLAQLVEANEASTGVRMSLIAAPLFAAGFSALAAWVIERRGRAARDGLTQGLTALAPLRAVWPVPSLLDPGVLAGQPLVFMLLLALLGLGLLRALNAALPVWNGLPHWAPLTRAPAWVPRTFLGVATAAFAAFGAFGSIRIHHKMLTSTFDLGLFENLFFNTLAGRHGIAVEIPYFGQHAELVLYAMVPIYKLFPHTETLLVIQAVLMAGTAVPLYMTARRYMGDGVRSLAVGLSYLAYPAVHGPLFFDFHFLSVSGFFIAWAAYFLLRRSTLAFWASLVLAMACREDVAMGVAVVALGGIAAGWPRRGLAITVASVAATWFVFLKFYWMQTFIRNTFAPYYADLIPAGQQGFSGVAQTLLSNPLYTFETLIRADKLLLGLQLLAPLLFLPAWRLRLWPLFVPGFVVVGLATSHGAILQVNFHYITHFVPYLFIGAILVLAVHSRDHQRAVVLAMLLTGLISTHRFGALFVDTFKTSFHEVTFDWTPEDAHRAADFEALKAQIPDTASVAAGEHEGPHLAGRSHMVSSKYGLRDFDYAITSRRSLRWGGKQHFETALMSRSYGVVEARGDFLLVQRGASAERNGEGLVFLK